MVNGKVGKEIDRKSFGIFKLQLYEVVFIEGDVLLFISLVNYHVNDFDHQIGR